MPDISHLPIIIETYAKLEPICSAAAGINIAYLALDRFRYKRLINAKAAEKLSGDLSDEIFKSITAFKQLVYLAGDEIPENCKTQANDLQINGNNKCPEGIAPQTYRYLFKRSVDEWVIVVFAAFSFVILCLSVAESEGLWTLIVEGLPAWFVEVSFYFLILAIIMPMIFVWSGRKCVTWATEKAEDMGKELKLTADRFKSAAAEVEVPALTVSKS